MLWNECCVPAPGDSLQRGIKAISCHGSSLWPLKLPHSGSPICYLATGPWEEEGAVRSCGAEEGRPHPFPDPERNIHHSPLRPLVLGQWGCGMILGRGRRPKRGQEDGDKALPASQLPSSCPHQEARHPGSVPARFLPSLSSQYPWNAYTSPQIHCPCLLLHTYPPDTPTLRNTFQHALTLMTL